jgi:hypothetical protein
MMACLEVAYSDVAANAEAESLRGQYASWRTVAPNPTVGRLIFVLQHSNSGVSISA